MISCNATVFQQLKLKHDAKYQKKEVPNTSAKQKRDEFHPELVSVIITNINKFEKGGLSGKPIEQKSNLLIKEFFKIFNNKIKIIGVGGVDSGKSAYEKFISGASYIQLYTGMVYQGPNIVNKISKELYEILSSNGVKNITEIIGSK